MKCEFPVLKRCCFCFPLRRGLLTLAYFKLLSCAALVILLIRSMFAARTYSHHDKTSFYTINGIFAIVSAVDVVFQIIFIVSAHKKEYRKMRVFYRYSFVCFVLISIGLIALLGYNCYVATLFYNNFLIVMIYYLLPVAAFVALIIGLQGYLIILVRSEILKLKNHSQFRFENKSEATCTAQITFDA